jgi:hypothetical protein
MRTIKIRTDQANLGETLKSMREWLDREKYHLSHFRHVSGDDGSIVISAGFANPDDPRIEAFHRKFGGLATPG